MIRLRRTYEQLQRLYRFREWYLVKPFAHALHAMASRTKRPKEEIFEEARDSLERPDQPIPTLARAELEDVLRRFAPPGIPYEAAFLRTGDLQGRFGFQDDKVYSPMLGRYQASFNDLPGKSVVVVALFSDVVADYYNETLADHLIDHVNRRAGCDVAVQDFALLRLKMIAAAAGLGTLGKNSLFFHPRFGFHVKISVILLHAELDDYSPAPPQQGPEAWKLSACATCNICVQACPVEAYDDFEMKKPISCERVISRDFFGHRRNKTCRACITSCPESTRELKARRAEGVPKNKFWDYDRQINFLSDATYRPPFFAWLMQRYYFGAGIPGTEREQNSTVRGQQAGRSNVEHAAFEARNGWISALREEREPEPEPGQRRRLPLVD